MRTIIKLIVLLCMAGAGPYVSAQSTASATESAAAEPNAAGKVELIEGDVRVTDRRNQRRALKVGDVIYEGDSIATGADGEIHLAMEDSGFIAVRPNTRMRIVQYRAQGDDQDKGIFSLLAGSFRSVTGWIGKYQPKAYKIQTKTATIGIRGTDHEPTVIPEGSTEGEPGTYDKVNAGGTYIQTAKGRIDVPEKKAAFAPYRTRPGSGGLRLLDSVPRFYRPTRHENLIEKKHDLIRQSMEKRREERRQHIRERIFERDKNKAAAHEQRRGQAQTRGTQHADREARRQQLMERRQKFREQKAAHQARPEREARIKHEAKAAHETKPRHERRRLPDNKDD